MSFKQWTAVVYLVVQVMVLAWVAVGIATDGPAASVAEAAWTFVLAIAAMIAVNIVAMIAFVITTRIAGRSDLRDEAADERDRDVAARSMRNAYHVASTGGALTLVLFAWGVDPVTAVCFLFATLMVAAATDIISQLVYYRTG